MSQKHEISTTPFPNSKKVYVDGTIHPIKVAMREITLSPTKLYNGGIEENPPVTVYDTSGPYTDENYQVDVRKGLPRIREQWILDRGDVEVLDEITSEYGKQRLNDEKLADLRFQYNHKPKRAKDGANVTQLYYAKQGIITPEMEYVAIRENQRIEQLEQATKEWLANIREIILEQTHQNQRLLLNLFVMKLLREERLSLTTLITLKANQ